MTERIAHHTVSDDTKAIVKRERQALRKRQALRIDQERRIVLGREVEKLSGLSRSTIWRGYNAGWFPRPVKISAGGRIGWYSDEIDEWLATRERA